MQAGPAQQEQRPAAMVAQPTERYRPAAISEAGNKSSSSTSSSDSSDSEGYSPITDELLIRKFAATLNWVLLDLSTPFRRLRSIAAALVFGLLIPLVRYAIAYCPTCPDKYSLQFQELVLVLEGALFAVSYTFLFCLLSRHSLSQVLFLETIDQNVDGLLTEYDKKIKGTFGTFGVLNTLLIPATITHIITQAFYYPEADLFYFAGVCTNSRLPHCMLLLKASLFLITAVSWIYHTLHFLLACSLFWLLCNLHVLKLLNFSDMLRSGETEMAIWIMEHRSLRTALRNVSHRFRLFIVLTAGTVVLGTWFSIYSLLHNRDTDLFNAGDIAVCNFVHLVGAALCLRAAAKITHRAQSIVGLASQMQAALSSLELKPLGQQLSLLRLSNSTTSLPMAKPTPASPTKAKAKPTLSNARSFGPGPLGLLQIDVEEDSGDKSSSTSSSSSSDVQNMDGVDLERGGGSMERGGAAADGWPGPDDSTRSSLWGPDESQRSSKGKGRRKGGRRVLRLKNPQDAGMEAPVPHPVALNSPLVNREVKDMDAIAQRLAAMESWCQRQALVAYLAHSRTGISVYGFVLDRAFVHGSLGILITSTLFVITRSLGA